MKDVETYKKILTEHIELEINSLKEMLRCLEYDKIEDLTDAFSYHYLRDSHSMKYWFYNYLHERNKK